MFTTLSFLVISFSPESMITVCLCLYLAFSPELCGLTLCNMTRKFLTHDYKQNHFVFPIIYNQQLTNESDTTHQKN